MINKDELKNIIDSTWIYLAKIFERTDVSGADVASIMLTLNCRFLNVIAKVCLQEEKDLLKKEFMDLIEEKLGRDKCTEQNI